MSATYSPPLVSGGGPLPLLGDPSVVSKPQLQLIGFQQLIHTYGFPTACGVCKALQITARDGGLRRQSDCTHDLLPPAYRAPYPNPPHPLTRPAPCPAPRTARDFGALGGGGADGDDERRAAAALRLLRLPPGELPNHVPLPRGPRRRPPRPPAPRAGSAPTHPLTPAERPSVSTRPLRRPARHGDGRGLALPRARAR